MIKFRLEARRDISPTTGCWIYTGQLDKDGYGKIKYKRKTHHVHRLAWRIYVGEPKNYVLHKLDCPNKDCFNPDHLYDGTHNDNMRDRKSNNMYINYDQYKTHCIRGHRFNEENTYFNKTTGYRQCRACRRERQYE